MRGKNKSHKIRLILGVLIGLSFVSVIFFSLYNRQNIKVSNKDKKTDVINETNNNQDNETLIEEVKEKDSNESIELNDNSTPKSEQKIEEIETPKNNNQDEEKNTTPKKEEKKEQKFSSESKNNTTITSTNTNKQNNNGVKETTQQKKETEWEKLGISEYDYYHKPMWSWARVDFSIDEYKTEQKTKEACESKGQEYFEQGLGYSCTSINSYVGTYLGEMLKTF